MHIEGWTGPTFPLLVLPCILCKERTITSSYNVSLSQYYFLCHQIITTGTNKHVHGTESFLRSYSSSTSQKISRILRSPKHHHRSNNSPPLVPIPRQVNAVYGLPIDFCNIHSNIILPITPTPYQ